ncbi:MAG: type II toxin-antitoxin system mRNA interferase toxin, RelE/StbE family [Campylobacterota bacterium]|nr:type II toxin-antitoxin system mRNA interferase toxin, RelE/StbE family [Campylobacterota bacterium]
MYEIATSDKFIKKSKKFFKKHPDLQTKFKSIIQQLTQDPFEPSLKTHKLKGNLQEFHACSLTYQYRILLSIVIVDNIIYLIDIGTHDEVY